VDISLLISRYVRTRSRERRDITQCRIEPHNLTSSTVKITSVWQQGCRQCTDIAVFCFRSVSLSGTSEGRLMRLTHYSLNFT